jgi:hypothetical protein
VCERERERERERASHQQEVEVLITSALVAVEDLIAYADV